LHAEAPWSAYTSSYGQAIESKAQNAIATQIHTFDRTFNNTYNNKCLGNSDVSNNNAVQYEGGRYASQYDPWLVYAQTYGQAEAQRAMAAQASSFERNLSASPTASNNNTNAKKQLSTDAPEVEKWKEYVCTNNIRSQPHVLMTWIGDPRLHGLCLYWRFII